MAYNNDVEHVIIKGEEDIFNLTAKAEQYPTHQLHEYVGVLLDSICEKQPVFAYPDYMVQDVVETFTLHPYNELQTLTIKPDSMISTVTLEVNGIQGLDWVNSIMGTINGTMCQRYIGLENLSDTPAYTLFNATHDGNTVKAQFNVFDLEKNRTGYRVTLFFWMDDKKVFLTLNASEHNISSSNNGKNIRIKVNANQNLRDFIAGNTNGGFNISIEEWDNHIIHVDVGF